MDQKTHCFLLRRTFEKLVEAVDRVGGSTVIYKRFVFLTLRISSKKPEFVQKFEGFLQNPVTNTLETVIELHYRSLKYRSSEMQILFTLKSHKHLNEKFLWELPFYLHLPFEDLCRHSGTCNQRSVFSREMPQMFRAVQRFSGPRRKPVFR